MRSIASARQALSETDDRLRHLAAALKQTPKAGKSHFADFQQLKEELAALRLRLSGDPIRGSLDESSAPAISSRVGQVIYGHWNTRQAPTSTQKRNIEIASRDFEAFQSDLRTYLDDLEEFEKDMEEFGAPYTRGRGY